MRIAKPLGLVVVTLLIAACSGHTTSPATPGDWTAVVYNRTTSAVYAVGRVDACSTLRISEANTHGTGESVPSGLVAVGPVRITTPAGYGGTVSVVVTASGAPKVTIGDVPEASLPTCQGMREN